MKKLSETTINLLNIISNARYRKGMIYDDEKLTTKERIIEFTIYLALEEVEEKMYKSAGISYEEFIANNYRNFDD